MPINDHAPLYTHRQLRLYWFIAESPCIRKIALFVFCTNAWGPLWHHIFKELSLAATLFPDGTLKIYQGDS